MFGIGNSELVIFLIIVLLIFGPKNLPKLAQALGRSVRELKNGMAGINDEAQDPPKPGAPVLPAQTIIPQPPEGQPVQRQTVVAEPEQPTHDPAKTNQS